MDVLQTFNRHDRQALAFNIALPVGAGLAVHAVAFALGWYEGNSATPPWFALPWWAVATVWLVLLALMATTRWMLNEYTIIGVVPARRMVSVLIIACLLWPVYSTASGSAMVGLIGTVIAAAISFATAIFVWQRSHKGVLPLVPVMLWLAFTVVMFLAQTGRLQLQ